METVPTPAELLSILQEVDLRIIRLRRELEDIPQRKRVIEAGIHDKQEQLTTARASVTKKQTENKTIEGDVASEQQKIRKLRDQQVQLKTNKEFKAMEEEVRVVESRISQLEEKEILTLEDIDRASRHVDAAKKELETAETAMRAELAGLDRRQAAVQEEMDRLSADRAEKARVVEPKWLRRYEPILAQKKERVLVRVDHGVCGGCNMTLPPHLIHDARRGTLMVSCPFCGRLLY